jgi:predicted SAM-dependent methyltransferase
MGSAGNSREAGQSSTLGAHLRRECTVTSRHQPASFSEMMFARQMRAGSLARGARKARDVLRRFGMRLVLRIKARRRPLKIVLGSSGVPVSGWLLTDMNQLNIVLDKDWGRYFQPSSVDAILAEHVWEHLTSEQAMEAARNCYAFLRPGGRLRLAVPDGLHPDPEYIDAVKPMGSAKGSDTHKILYTCNSLEQLLESAGFTTNVLECFDDEGNFVSADWDPRDGMVRRSARFDSRNHDGQLRYTSVIIDAFKPVHETFGVQAVSGCSEVRGEGRLAR